MNQRNNSKTINLTWKNGTRSAAFNLPPRRRPFVTDTDCFLQPHAFPPPSLRQAKTFQVVLKKQQHKNSVFLTGVSSVTLEPWGVEWCMCTVPHKVEGEGGEKKKKVFARACRRCTKSKFASSDDSGGQNKHGLYSWGGRRLDVWMYLHIVFTHTQTLCAYVRACVSESQVEVRRKTNVFHHYWRIFKTWHVNRRPWLATQQEAAWHLSWQNWHIYV